MKSYRIFIALLFILISKGGNKLAELKRAGIKLTAEGSAQYKADLKSATAALQQMAAESKRNIAALGQNASASKDMV